MSEKTKHERFVSRETLEQIAELIEPLSNYLGTPMTLFDADGNIFYRSTYPSPCSSIAESCNSEGSVCQKCYNQLLSYLKDIYDTPVMEKCSAGVEMVAFPIKTERQFPTRNEKQFIGMLCLNLPARRDDAEGIQTGQDQVNNMIELMENLLRQISMRNQDLGELVSQLLEFQNELIMFY